MSTPPENRNSHPQLLPAAGVLVMWLLLIGCGAPQPASKSDSREISHPQAVYSSAGPSTDAYSVEPYKRPSGENPNLEGAIKLGMVYTVLRQSMQSHGWTPIADAQCRANVIGANHQKLCGEHLELARCNVCDQLPGLTSCSGSGDCLLKFKGASDDQVLEVAMSGDIKNWNASGPDAMFYVSGWRHSTDAAK